MLKKYLLLAALMLLSLGLRSQEIRSVDIDVYINDDGDAFVQQRWDVTVVSGTEWYIPIGNLNGSKVRRLRVEENGEEFIDEGFGWSSDRSREEKAGRSGIIDKGKDGVELCWGQGEMGDHQWKASFVVLGMVQSLEDYDAFNFMFVNPGLIAAPQHASIRFHRLNGEPLTDEYVRFWVFGCEGESQFEEDGTIFFETDRRMPREGSLIVMMRFDKGIFNSANVRDMKFAKMQKKAFKGSTYKKASRFDFWDIIEIIVGALFVLAVVGIALSFLYFLLQDLFLRLIGRPWKRKVFGSSKPRGWAREAPFGGNIAVAAYLLKEGSRLMLSTHHPERRMGAYFLKWISDGAVTPVKAEDGHFDLAFPEQAPTFQDTCETSLYKKALEAAGENRILENGEFKAWGLKHSTSLVNWPDQVIKAGKARYEAFKGDKVAEAKKLLHFKNFLSEFTLAKEREVPEVGLWGQYLVFAQLFGIAEKVSDGLSKLYPDQFAAYSQKLGMDSDSMRYVVHYWTTDTTNAYKKAYEHKISQEASSRSSSGGYGGHSSFGGGGGFSGGGHGGGSR